jgi:hypothetical protein
MLLLAINSKLMSNDEQVVPGLCCARCMTQKQVSGRLSPFVVCMVLNMVI